MLINNENQGRPQLKPSDTSFLHRSAFLLIKRDQQDEAGNVTPGVGVVWKRLNSHRKSERDVIWWEIKWGRCAVRSRLWNPACVWGFCIHCRITVCSKGHYISKTLNTCSNGNIYFNTLYSICFCTSVRVWWLAALRRGNKAAHSSVCQDIERAFTGSQRTQLTLVCWRGRIKILFLL